MKSVLLYVSDDSAMEARLRSALELVRAFDGHLTCLQATPIEILAREDIHATLHAATEPVDAFHRQEERHRARLEDRLHGEGVHWDWVSWSEDPACALIEQASLADVVVLSVPNGNASPRSRALVSDVAVSIRPPVLVVREGLETCDWSGPALVAWNGSMAAAHALQSSLPLLSRAGWVRIVTIANDEPRFAATAAVQYLSRQGVHAEICDWQRGGGRVSEVLIDRARDLGGAYLVAGAGIHACCREAILGGVTRELIENASLPLLLAH